MCSATFAILNQALKYDFAADIFHMKNFWANG
jgi:hypothetical protein